MKTNHLIQHLEKKNPGEKEYLQSVKEVLTDIEDFYNQHPEYEKVRLIERLVEPDRIIIFNIPWVDDENEVHINRGYRVQFNNSLGPYKGGLRFHPSANLSIFKFLGFEQIFKNALTGLPLGAGKGGSDFDPKGKSDFEIMRFCQSFMNELYRHIGPDTDIPAGDIGVGGREIGYLYGHYKRMAAKNQGALTGKSTMWGGSWIRKEATGYGLIYIVNKYLDDRKDMLNKKKIIISGSGNVAIYAAEKATELGGIVIAMSDSNGFIHDPKGIELSLIKEIKEVNRGRIQEYKEKKEHVKFNRNHQDIWKLDADIALPCATENELDEKSAKALHDNNVLLIAEGANMPMTAEATRYCLKNKITVIPGKAANAGGVAVSGLEMTQNAMKLQWLPEEVDQKLLQIMHKIYADCKEYGYQDNGEINLIKGANIAAFQKIAHAMIDQGVI